MTVANIIANIFSLVSINLVPQAGGVGALVTFVTPEGEVRGTSADLNAITPDLVSRDSVTVETWNGGLCRGRFDVISEKGAFVTPRDFPPHQIEVERLKSITF
jgi:hypothetical protein